MFEKIEQSTCSNMDDSIRHLSEELSTVRAGRASLGLLDKVKVDYYGTMTSLNQVGSLSVPDARTIIIQPWEPALIQVIEKAIRSAELHLNPTNDGKMIRVVIPTLTEDRRRELVKLVKRMGEDSKVRIRNNRREGNEEIKGLKNNKEISEDDARKYQDVIQKHTDSYVKKIDKLLAGKEAEIMEL